MKFKRNEHENIVTNLLTRCFKYKSELPSNKSKDEFMIYIFLTVMRRVRLSHS